MVEKKNNNFEPYISSITIRELMKWLRYVPDFKKEEMKRINSKRIDELSCEELEVVLDGKKQERMFNLLSRVNSSDITEEEYKEVIDYIDSEPIEDLMKTKLSEKEQQETMDKIKHFYYVSNEEIINKIEEERKKGNYEKLSMIDSYVFHVMLEVYCVIEMKKLEDKIYNAYNYDEPKVLSHKLA